MPIWKPSPLSGPNDVRWVSSARLIQGASAKRPSVSLSSQASLKFSSCTCEKASFGLV